jgi:hypothetical protein
VNEDERPEVAPIQPTVFNLSSIGSATMDNPSIQVLLIQHKPKDFHPLSFLATMDHGTALHLEHWLELKIPEEFQDPSNGGIYKGS